MLMRLNLHSDYALRLLMHLAANREALITITETANRYDISKNHLMKVAHLLGKAGFIETIRGRSGGLRLARDPSDINIGDVVRHTEGDFAIVECLPGGKGTCFIAPSCRLKHVMKEATDAFISVLDQYNLGYLMKNNIDLLSMLGNDAA